MTALSTMSGPAGGEEEQVPGGEELERRPAYSSLSPGPRGGGARGKAATEGESAKGPGWTLSPKEVATSPRTGTRASAPRVALEEEEEEEEEEDPEEEEIVRGILSSQPGVLSSRSAPGAGLHHEKGGGPSPHAAAATSAGAFHAAMPTGGISEMTHHAATVASAEVGGGTMPATSFLGSLTFVQVQMMSFIVVFSASGLVSWNDMIFAVFCTLYCAFLSLWFFPLPGSSYLHHTRASPPRVFSDSLLFKVHVFLGAVLGMFLPLSYVLGGFARGDHEAVQCATPHLFLLCCQVLTENLLVTIPRCSLPVRAILPMMYNIRRLFSLAAWIRSLHHPMGGRPSAAGPELIGAAAVMGASGLLSPSGSTPHPYWSSFGKFLALANLLYWAGNLLGFLIPVFLPLAFRRHFEAEEEAKASERRKAE